MTMSGAKALILVIDDDAELLATLGDFLLFENYEVETATSGEDGMVKLAGIVPDLIILDISMPGMGGVGFLKEMSSNKRIAKVPVLVFTARSNMEKFFREVEVAGFMPKPCDPAALLKEIRRILAGNGTGGAMSAGGAVTRARKKVLLAEDEASERDWLVAAFTEAGFDTIAVSSNPEVVERTIVEKPDALLLKLVMERMNGDVAASMLMAIPSTRNIPIILYDETGSTPHERVLNEDGPGIRRLIRSVKAEDLVKAVIAVCRG